MLILLAINTIITLLTFTFYLGPSNLFTVISNELVSAFVNTELKKTFKSLATVFYCVIALQVPAMWVNLLIRMEIMFLCTTFCAAKFRLCIQLCLCMHLILVYKLHYRYIFENA